MTAISQSTLTETAQVVSLFARVRPHLVVPGSVRVRPGRPEADPALAAPGVIRPHDLAFVVEANVPRGAMAEAVDSIARLLLHPVSRGPIAGGMALPCLVPITCLPAGFPEHEAVVFTLLLHER